jgi:hypothetical protein
LRTFDNDPDEKRTADVDEERRIKRECGAEAADHELRNEQSKHAAECRAACDYEDNPKIQHSYSRA